MSSHSCFFFKILFPWLVSCLRKIFLKNSLLFLSPHPLPRDLYSDHSQSISFFFHLIFFIVVQLQLSPFSSHHSPPSYPPPSPTSILLPFGFVNGFFIRVPWWPYPLFLLFSPSSTPLLHMENVFQETK